MLNFSETTLAAEPQASNGHPVRTLVIPLQSFDPRSQRQTDGIPRDFIDWCRARLMEPIVKCDELELSYAIGLNEQQGLTGSIPRKLLKNEELVLKQLVTQAATLQQTRSELEARDRDLGAVLDHVSQLYGHITLAYKVAHALKKDSSLDGIIRSILLDLPAAIQADAAGLYVTESEQLSGIRVTAPDNAQIALLRIVESLEATSRNQEIVIETAPPPQRSDRSDHGSICAARITTTDQRRGWLLAYRAHGKFGTEEGQLLRSLANVLAGQLDTAALLAEKDLMLLSIIRSFVSALDARDEYTRGHSERVAEVAEELARRLGLCASECEDIHLSGLLHDIGKIGVPDSVLRKTEKLTAEDWFEIKKHPVTGEEILQGIRPLEKILPGVRFHHEALDGSGYPDGLSGDKIPYMARILAVADAFDAMSSDRPYRKGKSPDEVDRILQAGAGKQWDPGVVTTFLNNKDKIRKLWLTQFDSCTPE